MSISRFDKIKEGLTFDDVLLVPSYSEVLPREVSIASKFSRNIQLNSPIVSAAMDTVTEAKLAISIAQQGGIGVIHKNLTPEEQAAEVHKVKKFESGMIVNPLTISPEATLADALAIKEAHGISGIPVVEKVSGKLVGILTNRDVRFASRMDQLVSELMTGKDPEKPLITTREGVDLDEARKLLHQHRIEKLLVVDDDFLCIPDRLPWLIRYD